jgi:hypothetical protein
MLPFSSLKEESEKCAENLAFWFPFQKERLQIKKNSRICLLIERGVQHSLRKHEHAYSLTLSIPTRIIR